MNVDKHIYELPLDNILPNRFQPRIAFDDKQIYELSESIKQNGVFSPIIVRKLGDKYEIIAGERRYKASVMAGKTTIPAIISSANDDETIKIALLENVQRSNLSPIEEAISYKKISDMGNISQEKLAKMLGKTQATVANKLRLLKLSEEVQEALMENKISERHARSLLRIKNYEDQNKMLTRIINERLTVRKLDEEIDIMKINNEGLEFIDLDNETMNIDIPNEQQTVKNVVIEENKIMDVNDQQTNKFFNYNFNNDNLSNQNEIDNNEEKILLENDNLINNQNKKDNERLMEDTIFNFEPIKNNDNQENKIEFDNLEDIQIIDDIPLNNNDYTNINNLKENEIPTNSIIDETLNVNDSLNIKESNNNYNYSLSIDDAKDKIAKLINDLKISGYIIEINEFNLETVYQINIKIEK